MTDNLQEHINSLERSSAYQVERLIKQTSQEITEEVSFEGRNGAKLGSFVRKRIDRDSDLGRAYEVLYGAQQANQRFLYLPRIRECYRTEDELVVVMDWVAGETLAETLQHEQPSLEFAAPLFVKLCEAVIELHTSFDPPIIHRGITPGNVVLSGGTPTLIDLGIARRYNEDAASDTHQLGTYGFAAPEQFGFGQSDVRTDIYGLGMILYYCCTGLTPDAQARSQRFRNQNVPEEVRLVIEKATALSSVDRYDSVKALRQAFVDALQAYRRRLEPALPPQPPASGTPNPVAAPPNPSSFVALPLKEPDAVPVASSAPFVVSVIWDSVLVVLWLISIILIFVVGTFTDPETGAVVPVMERPLDLALVVLVITAPVPAVFSSRSLQAINQKWRLTWKMRLMILGCELCLFMLLVVAKSIFQ